MKKILFLLLFASLSVNAAATEMEKARKAPTVHPLLWHGFSLGEVRLTDSYFKTAMELDRSYLLSLEVDRLIPHIRRQSGLEPKGKNYGGWEASGGCSYGHYMSACAMMYAATGDKEFLERLNYMISELEQCHRSAPEGWFVGGARSREGFKQMTQGNVVLNRPDETGQPWNFNQNGNGWYGVHKVFSGLRDAYVYAGMEDALRLLVPLADHVAQIALNTNSDLFQSTFSVEQGGMGEVMADIYAITGDKKYLETAERFNHINVIYKIANGEDVLFGRHANDQIPKFMGVARQYEFSPNDLYLKAAGNFWDIVIRDHTLAIGGNSCYERFGIPGQESKRLDFTSAETCNTHNMLKLSRQLFMLNGDTKYLDYYEHALYNHILASIDPDMPGGFTYYTSLMPGLLKQYSTPYESFWCCVGTGMENHAKYAESIFFENGQELLTNLYIPSVLEWKKKGLKATLATGFPETDEVTLTIDRLGDFNGIFLFRYPSWVTGEASVKINGKPAKAQSVKGEYIRLMEEVVSGDKITIILPQGLNIRYTKDEPYFGYLTYGPLVLAGALGQVDMPADRVGDNRELRHIEPLKDIPMLVGAKTDLASWIVRSPGEKMSFKVRNFKGNKDVELLPYFLMHHQRYTVYWKVYSPDEFACREKVLADKIMIGDTESEKRHKLTGKGDSLVRHDFFWANNRVCRTTGAGGSFSYEMSLNKGVSGPYYLICNWWGDEGKDRRFRILVDGSPIADVDLYRRLFLTYVDDVYPIPAGLTEGKSRIRVTFESGTTDDRVGGLYGLTLTADPDFR